MLKLSEIASEFTHKPISGQNLPSEFFGKLVYNVMSMMCLFWCPIHGRGLQLATLTTHEGIFLTEPVL